MDKKKKSPASAKTGLMKKGELLIDSAKKIAESSDPVNLIASLIRYRILAEKAYRQHMKVK